MKSLAASVVWCCGGVALVAIAVALASVPFSRARARCRDAAEAVREIPDAALAFRKEEGRWPDSILELVTPKRAPGAPVWVCVLPPTDPWGHQYLLEVESERFSVLCLGRDNRRGGWGEDAGTVSSAESAWPPLGVEH